MKALVIHTDGSSKHTDGHGGWGYHYPTPTGRVKGFGGATETTNKRMELTAAMEGIKSARTRYPDRPLVVISDSQYVVKGISEWVFGWRNNGWINSQGQPVKNRDLWVELFALCRAGNISFQWVKGHNGNELNELADELAGMGRAQTYG